MREYFTLFSYRKMTDSTYYRASSSIHMMWNFLNVILDKHVNAIWNIFGPLRNWILSSLRIAPNFRLYYMTKSNISIYIPMTMRKIKSVFLNLKQWVCCLLSVVGNHAFLSSLRENMSPISCEIKCNVVP